MEPCWRYITVTSIVAHLCSCLAICVRQGHNALVHLNARKDTLAFQDVHKQCPVCSWLEECLLKQDLQQVQCRMDCHVPKSRSKRHRLVRQQCHGNTLTSFFLCHPSVKGIQVKCRGIRSWRSQKAAHHPTDVILDSWSCEEELA